MARRVLVRAIALSLGLHAVAMSLVLLAPAWPWPLLAREQSAEAAPLPSLSLPDDDQRSAWTTTIVPATEIELRSVGDEDRVAAAPSAPSDAPEPDPRTATAARSGGDGNGAPTRVTDRSDRASLQAEPYDATHGYQMQRIRSGDARESREDVRATPHPALSPWLSLHAGAGHAREMPPPSPPPRAAEVARDPEPARGREVLPAQLARVEVPPVREDAEGKARPWLARDPAATDSAARSEDVSDRIDVPAVSDVRRPDAVELTRPANPGTDHAATGEGALGFKPDAQGTAPVPAGAPELPRGPLRVSSYQRQYDQYVSRVKEKVDPLWEFPRDLAIRLEQGDLLVAFTIQRDGRLKDLRLLKRSGFPSFDKNVLSAIKKAAPFAPLPSTLGSELRVTAPFTGGSPAIR